MAQEKMVEVTVKKDDIVADGEGGFCAKGDKIKVPESTADALKERGLA